jgi:hypothetical protein
MPLRLLRYLCVWQVNSSLVRLAGPFWTLELTRVLGTLISERLPSRQAAPWRKALVADTIAGPQSPMPQRLWPLEAVLMRYPAKRTYSRGELLFWELKLFGDAADHDLFLELILPAMEEAGYTSDQRWQRHNGLWGHFDVYAVRVARGRHWEPLVEQGRLDLRYHPTPWQWTEDRQAPAPQPSVAVIRPRFRRVRWLTPFDPTLPPINAAGRNGAGAGEADVPECLAHLLALFLLRLNELFGNTSGDPLDLPGQLNADEQDALAQALLQGADIRQRHHELESVRRSVPGRWRGTQVFEPVPPELLPYLDLASLLHIGGYTQFGCGTFLLS